MHSATFAVLPLSFVGSAGERAIGTGFLWRHNREWWLITNWHNVTGVRPDNRTFNGGFVPVSLEVTFKYYTQKPNENGEYRIGSLNATYPLYRDNIPLWVEHDAGYVIDCVALHIEIDQADLFAGRAINEIPHLEANYVSQVGEEVFVVGYPRGMTGQGATPIWKRGSIASEPALNQDHLPLVLIDTATREGMSGSPVFVRHHGIYFGGPELTDESSIGTVEAFFGVYSGRIGEDEMGVQLGRVWKAPVVDQIIAVQAPGKHPLDIVYPVG
ncbi:hypothetical protein FF80_04140 [Devosia sp. LC5]|uniref:S1 family peptidase n=1 Tax=Devosia sp. LC5 TaxID=1502724 RepID=UPI0004E30558|nr:serine protease [Devosia sp. LC5]KFC61348.1 hypothetical protein FF80_04140 [Devosia sp. LC5]